MDLNMAFDATNVSKFYETLYNNGRVKEFLTRILDNCNYPLNAFFRVADITPKDKIVKPTVLYTSFDEMVDIYPKILSMKETTYDDNITKVKLLGSSSRHSSAIFNVTQNNVELFMKTLKIDSKDEVREYVELLKEQEDKNDLNATTLCYKLNDHEHILYIPKYFSEPIIQYILSKVDKTILPNFPRNTIFSYDKTRRTIAMVAEPLKPLDTYFSDNTIPDSIKYKYFIFALARTLYMSFKLFKFSHNDLHIGNVMVRLKTDIDLTKNTRVYINQAQYVDVPNNLYKYEFVFIDFGFTSITLPIIYKDGSYDTVRFLPRPTTTKIPYAPNLYYDFLHLMALVMKGKMPRSTGVSQEHFNTLRSKFKRYFPEITSSKWIYETSKEFFEGLYNVENKKYIQNFLITACNQNAFFPKSTDVPIPSSIINSYDSKLYLFNNKVKVHKEITKTLLGFKLPFVSVVKYVGKFKTKPFHLAKPGPNHLYNNDIYCMFVNSAQASKMGYTYKSACCAVHMEDYMKNKTGLLMNASYFDQLGTSLDMFDTNDPTYLSIGDYKSSTGVTGIPYKASPRYEYPDPLLAPSYIVKYKDNNTLYVQHAQNIENRDNLDFLIETGPPLKINGVDAVSDKILESSTRLPDGKRVLKYTCHSSNKVDYKNYKGIVQSVSCKAKKAGSYYHIANPNPRAVLISSQGHLMKTKIKGKFVSWDSIFFVCRGRSTTSYGLDVEQELRFINEFILNKSMVDETKEKYNNDKHRFVSIINVDGGGSAKFIINDTDNTLYTTKLGDNMLHGSVIELTK